jgi:5-hydroxyisourate hydrolase-like protein (transthyretin family)
MGEVQKIARNRALEDISSQIKVKIESGTVASEITVQINKEFFDSSVFIQNIRTYTDAILEGVEIAEAKTTQDGYYWVKLILNKNEYFRKLNETVNNAKQIAVDALMAAEKSDPVKRVYELQTALKSIDNFKGKLLQCSLGGEEIILNTEILRRMRQTLNDFVIKASIDELETGPLESFPDSIGFYVIYQNLPVENCQLHWSVSNNDVKLLSLPGRSSGFYPVKISSLGSSAGKVIVTASIDFSPINEDLKNAGLKAPVGKFIISRKKPALF